MDDLIHRARDMAEVTIGNIDDDEAARSPLWIYAILKDAAKLLKETAGEIERLKTDLSDRESISSFFEERLESEKILRKKAEEDLDRVTKGAWSKELARLSEANAELRADRDSWMLKYRDLLARTNYSALPTLKEKE